VRFVAWGSASLINAAVLVGLKVAPVFQPDDLPEPFQRQTITLLPWPLSSELGPILLEATEEEVQAFFDDHDALPRATPGLPRCLRYYCPAATVTVLLPQGHAKAVWVDPEPVPQGACATLVHRPLMPALLWK